METADLTQEFQGLCASLIAVNGTASGGQKEKLGLVSDFFDANAEWVRADWHRLEWFMSKVQEYGQI